MVIVAAGIEAEKLACHTETGEALLEVFSSYRVILFGTMWIQVVAGQEDLVLLMHLQAMATEEEQRA